MAAKNSPKQLSKRHLASLGIIVAGELETPAAYGAKVSNEFGRAWLAESVGSAGTDYSANACRTLQDFYIRPIGVVRIAFLKTHLPSRQAGRHF